MRIYLQLDTWDKLLEFYSIFKYLPNSLKEFVGKRWLKPVKIPWENGPELYVLPICRQVNHNYSVDNGIVLPQDTFKVKCSLITTLLIDILPQLAKLASINYEEDVLLIKDLEGIADVRFLEKLISPWRYIIVHGSNRLKIKWWQEFCIRETGQVLQLREDIEDLNISCVCCIDSIPELNHTLKPKLLVALNNENYVLNTKIASQFRVKICEDYPDILKSLYGDYLPDIVIEEWLKSRGIYHQILSNWHTTIQEELGQVNVVNWRDNIVYVKIG